MYKVLKILTFLLSGIVTFSVGVTNQESTSINQIDESADSSARNARYIKLSPSPGNQYYPYNPGSYYPSRDYFYPSRDYYPNRDYYPDRYPNYNPGGSSFTPVYSNKFDPNYWLSKLPNFPTSSYPNNIPNYPNYPNLPNYPNYPSQYPSGGGGTNFIGQFTPSRYPNYGGYNPGYGGYGGYQGNGGFLSYNGYDGYDATGNRPGNIGFGYQQSTTGGPLILGNRYPTPSIVTPSSVSKDA